MDKDETQNEAPLAAPQAAPAQAPGAVSAPVAKPRRASAAPMLLAGLVVAGAGLGAGYYLRGANGADQAAMLAAQEARFADIEAEISAMPDPVDIAPLESALAVLATEQAGISAELGALRDEIAALAAIPAPGENVSAIAFAAMQTRLADIAARFDALKAETEARVAAAVETAETARDNLAEDSRIAAAQGALARLKTAFVAAGDMGGPIADLIDNGISVPQAVLDAADGMPTLSELREAFPEAARAALAAAREAGVSGETGGAIMNYLRSALDIRSVSAQAGDTVDAILSRAEAALGDGRLAAALDELAALPPEAADKMQDWIATARARIDVGAAIDALMPPATEN